MTSVLFSFIAWPRTAACPVRNPQPVSALLHRQTGQAAVSYTHLIKAIIKVCFTLDVVLIIWVKGLNLINQTGLRSIALTKLFFLIGNLLFTGGCIYLNIDFLLHHRRKLRIADQFDNNPVSYTHLDVYKRQD